MKWVNLAKRDRRAGSDCRRKKRTGSKRTLDPLSSSLSSSTDDDDGNDDGNLSDVFIVPACPLAALPTAADPRSFFAAAAGLAHLVRPATTQYISIPYHSHTNNTTLQIYH